MTYVPVVDPNECSAHGDCVEIAPAGLPPRRHGRGDRHRPRRSDPRGRRGLPGGRDHGGRRRDGRDRLPLDPSGRGPRRGRLLAREYVRVPRHRAHRTPGRHTHWRLARRRHLLLRGGTVAALLAVVGPGLLAGLSDDDPAGITTYSILGAKYGYELLWVLALSTAALIVFHELGVRLGIVTGKGLLTLVRERYGQRAAGARRSRRSWSPTPAPSAPSSPASPRGWSCSAA